MKLREYDNHAKFKTIEANGQSREVLDTGASAKANLKEAGRNLLHIVDPTNHFRETWGQTSSNHIAAGILAGFKVLMIPWDIGREILDVPLGPIKALKNGTDAAMYGVLYGLEKAGLREPK